MNHRYITITSDMADCHPAALPISGCRVRDYNDIINIFPPPPDINQNALAQPLLLPHLRASLDHLRGRRVVGVKLSGRGELEITDVNNYYFDLGRDGI